MPNAQSYKIVVPELEGLVSATEENLASLPDVTDELNALKSVLVDIKTLKLRQESLLAGRQETTQNLHNALSDGQDVAQKLRDAAKFKFGRRSERLVHFRVAPLRPRRRKNAAEAPVPEDPAPETPPPATP
jgi:hypothetical protein